VIIIPVSLIKFIGSLKTRALAATAQAVIAGDNKLFVRSPAVFKLITEKKLPPIKPAIDAMPNHSQFPLKVLQKDQKSLFHLQVKQWA